MHKKGVMIMKEESTNRKSSILIPALMGSVVGAGTALLLAPKSGEKIRKDLKRFAEDTRDQVGEVIDEGRKVVARTLKAGKETYDEGTEKIEKLMHKKGRLLMVLTFASGIIGMGIALLLTTKSGYEVRGDIKRIATNAGEKFVTAIDKGKALYLGGAKT